MWLQLVKLYPLLQPIFVVPVDVGFVVAVVVSIGKIHQMLMVQQICHSDWSKDLNSSLDLGLGLVYRETLAKLS